MWRYFQKCVENKIHRYIWVQKVLKSMSLLFTEHILQTFGGPPHAGSYYWLNLMRRRVKISWGKKSRWKWKEVSTFKGKGYQEFNGSIAGLHFLYRSLGTVPVEMCSREQGVWKNRKVSAPTFSKLNITQWQFGLSAHGMFKENNPQRVAIILKH